MVRVRPANRCRAPLPPGSRVRGDDNREFSVISPWVPAFAGMTIESSA